MSRVGTQSWLLPAAALPAVVLLGLYQVLLGTALLISPHWFAEPAYEPLRASHLPVGVELLAAGTGLLWIVLLPVRQPPIIVTGYLLSVVNFCLFAVLFLRTGPVQGLLAYGVVAGCTLLLLMLHSPLRMSGVARVTTGRPHATIVHLIAFVLGTVMLVRSGSYADSLSAAMRPWLGLVAPGFAVLGGALLARDLFAPRRWQPAASVVELALAVLLAGWGLAHITSQAWTDVLSYLLAGLAIVDTALLRRWGVWRRLQRAVESPLRRRLALTMATALIATAIVLTVTLTANSADDAVAEARRDAEELANVVAEQLSSFLGAHVAAVGQVARLPDMRAMDQEQAGLILREARAAFPRFSNLSLVDRSGQQLVRASGGQLVNLSDRSHIQRALAGQRNVSSEVVASATTGEPIVVMAAPVVDATTDEAVGAVSASIQLPSVSTFLSDLSVSRAREIFVLDAAGMLVGHANQELLATRDVYLGTPIGPAVQAGRTGSLEYELNGQGYLAGYAPVTPYGWAVVIQQPASLALASVWAIEDRAFLVLLVASVLLLGLAALLGDRLFRPMVGLLGPLRALGEGRYEVALPPAEEGEVGDIVRAFDRMRVELRQREAALAASEARFRSLVENGSDVVVVLDREGHVRMVNPTVERVLGYAPAELVGERVPHLIHPDDLALARETLAAVSAEPRGERRVDLHFQHRDGTWRCFEMVMQNRLDDPSVLGVVANARDITEQRELQAERDRLHAELAAEVRRAAEIQAQLLPQTAPDLNGYDIAAVCLPAREVGGDFFDWTTQGGSIRLALGDVMGKGVPAALLTATVRAALRSVGQLPVAAAVTAVNHAVAPDLAQSDGFVTLFYASLEAATGKIEYVDAGHGMVFVLRRHGSIDLLPKRGLPLGVFGDVVYAAGSLVLEAGDTLVIYSDGLPDARPDLRLDQAGVAGQVAGPDDVQAKLDRLVRLVMEVEARPDDLTLLLVRRDEAVEAAAEPAAVATAV